MSDGKRLLVVAAGCEALTGLGLVVDPPFVVQLLLGARPSGSGRGDESTGRHRVARAGDRLLAGR